MAQIPKLKDIKRVHMIGIGGIGMSGLARFFVHEGVSVSGTNDSESPHTLNDLRKQGVQISLDQNILPAADLYVFSEAWRSINPHLLRLASESGVPTANYFEALGMVVNSYYLIAVAGTHGKTTTTAMLIDVFERAGKDPTAIVGSLRATTKSNFRAGKSKYAIVEACEYRRDFLSLTPDVLVITNIEHDHVDYYADLCAVQDAFIALIRQVQEGGVVVLDAKHPNMARVIENIPSEIQVIDYTQYVDLQLKLLQPGMHNLVNASAVTAVARHEKIDTDTVKSALEQFKGTWRRFENRGTLNGATVIDDYAHHPTEIRATISGARELYKGKRIVTVFQSHTYTRTYTLFSEFVDSLTLADEVIIAPIYAARERNESGVSGENLSVEIGKKNPNTQYIESHEAIAEYLRSTVGKDDVVLIMGAGDITDVADMLIR